MKKLQTTNRLLSLMLAMSMVFSWMPTTVFAAEGDALCDHHPVHTADCHYAEAVPGQPCTHVHDEACGYVEAVEETPCACTEVDETGETLHTEGCGYVAAVSAVECSHTHDETCGYAEAVEGHECHFVCTECASVGDADHSVPQDTTEPAAECTCGTEDEIHLEDCALYVAPVGDADHSVPQDTTAPAVECTCESDDPDWHAPFCALYEASEDAACTCAELCDTDAPNEWCEVCYFDADACEGSDEEQGVAYALTQDANSVYQIGTAQDLLDFAALVNGGTSNANAVLTKDITIPEGTTWTPIKSYTGTFDGQNHTVSGLVLESTSSSIGLFATVKDGGTVQNVGVINSSLSGYDYVGTIAGNNYGTVRNCRSSGTIGGHYYIGGVVGYNGDGGTVTGCSNSGTVTGEYAVGGVVGSNGEEATVTNCYNTGTIDGGGDTTSGGVVGLNFGSFTNSWNSGAVNGSGVVGHNSDTGTVESCYSTGTVSGSGVVYTNKGTITNCYYLSETDTETDELDGTTAKTEAQFASGEVAYLLNGDQTNIIWGQTIGTDAYPVLGGDTVYQVLNCANAEVYSNTDANLGHVYEGSKCTVCGADCVHSYDNGFCVACGSYQPAELNEETGVYEIGNAGQLLDFAALVNGGNKTANAILTADIDMSGIAWTPICSTGLYYSNSYASGYGDNDTGYAGIFDGDGHVIKNLSVTAIANETWTYGLFGTMTGTVKNLGIEGFTYDHNGASDMRTGAIVGQNLGGTIENCYVVGATINPGTNVAGGITGCNYAGTIKNCYVANSSVSASASRYGYIVGDNRADTAGDRVGTIENCYTDGDRLVGSYTGTETNSKSGVYYTYFKNGNVVWQLNGQSADGIWKQGETHPAFTGTAVTNALISAYTQPEQVNGVYQIKTESELRWFAEYVNSTDASVSAVLANNIAMTGDNWIPIGSEQSPYTGTFNGQGYAITGFAMNITGSGYHGLFGVIQDATVKNFSIDGQATTNNTADGGYFGVIGLAKAVNAYCYVEDIRSTVDYTVNDVYDKQGVGGIVGYAAGTSSSPWQQAMIERCSYGGTIDLGSAFSDCTGGIVGYVAYNSDVRTINCLFDGAIHADYTGTLQLGGIMGYNRGANFRMLGCLSIGKIDVPDTTFVGQLAGRYLQTNGAARVDVVMLNNHYYSENSLPAVGTSTGMTYSDIEMSKFDTFGADNAQAVTEAQLASGEIAYQLAQGYKSTDGTTKAAGAWGQTLGEEEVPVLGGETVYQVKNCKGDTAYSNTNANLGHIYAGSSTCTVAGQAAHTAPTTTASVPPATAISLRSILTATATTRSATRVSFTGSRHRSTAATKLPMPF